MNKYTNQQLTSAEVIAELIDMAREVAAEASRGARFSPPLNSDELASYDAVAQNESAVAQQGEDVLAKIARELVAVMRRDVRTDWTVRDDVRAKLRSSIRRLLVSYGYPPDSSPPRSNSCWSRWSRSPHDTRQTAPEPLAALGVGHRVRSISTRPAGREAGAAGGVTS